MAQTDENKKSRNMTYTLVFLLGIAALMYVGFVQDRKIWPLPVVVRT